MNIGIFVINSILLGVGLAMDAFSVSMANGLREPQMSGKKTSGIAGTFAGFQFLMPMIGWICVHTIAEYFTSFQKLIPWIALVLLAYIGGKMVWEGVHEGGDAEEEDTDASASENGLGVRTLMLQGIATSIDALSVGFTISDYALPQAFVCALLIAAVTYIICVAGVKIGRKFGTKLAGKASILGGMILIGIGLEIFLKGVL